MLATFVKSLTKLEELPDDDRPQVAMVGRSNVGKSSLINHLTKQKSLARVSSAPGRTQTINVYDIHHQFYLIDLPGYGFTQGSKKEGVAFSQMISAYLSNVSQLRLVLLVVDASIPPSDLDQDMRSFLKSLGLSVLLILNKVDKQPHAKSVKLLRQFAEAYPDIPHVVHSITTVKNVSQIWQVIEASIKI